MCKELKERFNITEYCYIAYPEKKVCIEIEDAERGRAYIQTFGGILHTNFPYEEYGYEDPYNFTNEWELFGTQGRITYEVNDKGIVEEVIGGII